MTEANNNDYRVGNDGFWARAWVTPLVVAAAGFLLAVFTAGPDRLGYAYLFGLFTVVTFMLGGLFLVLIQFLTAAHWGVSSRRIPEVIMSGAPVVLNEKALRGERASLLLVLDEPGLSLAFSIRTWQMIV